MYGYDLGDFGKAFDADKAGKSARTPRWPKVNGQFKLNLKRLVEKEGDKSGKMFTALFEVTASNNDMVIVGATYEKAFFQGASKVDREKCWRKILPLVLAVMGKSALDPKAIAEAPNLLGELLAISTGKKDPATGKVIEDGVDLNLQFGLSCKLETARPDKNTGKVDPKFLDEQGNPKVFSEDTYTVVAA